MQQVSCNDLARIDYSDTAPLSGWIPVKTIKHFKETWYPSKIKSLHYKLGDSLQSRNWGV